MTYEIGDTVVFTDAELHAVAPRLYPPVGTEGAIRKIDGDGDMWVQWPPELTGGDGIWCCPAQSMRARGATP